MVHAIHIIFSFDVINLLTKIVMSYFNLKSNNKKKTKL